MTDDSRQEILDDIRKAKRRYRLAFAIMALAWILQLTTIALFGFSLMHLRTTMLNIIATAVITGLWFHDKPTLERGEEIWR